MQPQAGERGTSRDPGARPPSEASPPSSLGAVDPLGIGRSGRAAERGLAGRAVGLLRFDFVPAGDRDEVMDRLEAAFGSPAPIGDGADLDPDGAASGVFVGDPERLGFGADLAALTVRVLEPVDGVVEIRTAVTPAPGGAGVRRTRRPDWREWERSLEGVRSFVPGEALGPETTVWWVDLGASTTALPVDPTDPDGLDRVLEAPPDGEIREVVDVATERGYVVLDGQRLVVAGGTDPAEGHLVGRLVALDLGDDVEVAIDSGGRELPGSWSALSALLAIDYWARSTTQQVGALGDRLDATVSGLAAGGAEAALDRAQVSRLLDLHAEWAGLSGRLGRQLRTCRRRLRTTGRSSGPLRDGTGVLAAELDRLGDDLEAVADDIDRVGDRLSAASTLAGAWASLVAARDRRALEGAVEVRPVGTTNRDPMARWILPTVVVVGLVLVADALMSGGIERFVDRLFAEGLAAFTPQVVAGLVVLAAALVTVLAVRHRSRLVGRFRRDRR